MRKFIAYLIISTITFIFFGVFGLMPIINFITGNVDAGHIIAIITIPVSILFLIASIVYLIKAIKCIKKFCVSPKINNSHDIKKSHS